jgi:hypothetical protein
LGKWTGKESAPLKLLIPALLGFLVVASAARAEIEQCRFIQAKAEREACYERQAIALAAKRKPEPAADPRAIESIRQLESLRQMRQEDEEVYKSLHSICRGC